MEALNLKEIRKRYREVLGGKGEMMFVTSIVLSKYVQTYVTKLK